MSEQLTVRLASLGDQDTIADFNSAMAMETESLRLDPDTLRAGVRAVLEDDAKGRYYVAEEDGRVVGQLMVTFEWSDWRNSTFLWLQSVYVLPQHRRQGVFRALYRHLERGVAPEGCCGIRLYVETNNQAARRAYESIGMAAPAYVIMETRDPLRR